MTGDELRRAQMRLGLSGAEMAEQIGISERAYYYRLSGDLPIRSGEAKVVNMMLAAQAAALAKGGSHEEG